VCVCTWMRAHVRICVLAHASVRAYVSACVCVRVRLGACLRAYVDVVCVCACVCHACKCVIYRMCAYVCVHVCKVKFTLQLDSPGDILITANRAAMNFSERLVGYAAT